MTIGPRTPRRITVLTDFGTADGYVAAVKGVLASLTPSVWVDDAGHDVPRGDVEHAAWALHRYWSRYPEGTVHLVVVDPGVGTDRRALALEAGGRFGVGPDNGVFTRVLEHVDHWRAVAVDVPSGSSATFHGRDVFAPAAARLAAGAALEELGAPAGDLVELPGRGADRDRGVVRTVDRFGNLVTDLPANALSPGAQVVIAGQRVASAGTYGEVGPGDLVALRGSDGTVEIAVRNGSAATALGVGVGTPLRVVGST